MIHQENGGAFSARNAGLDAEAGEYIGFVDPDDYVDTSMYARLVETAQRHGAEAVSYTHLLPRPPSIWTPAAFCRGRKAASG